MLSAPVDAARPWPLTGRRSELDGGVAALLSGHVDALLLTGPAGVGKSRLMREIVERLGPSASVAWVAGSTGTSEVPLGALAHLLPRRLSTDPVSLLAEAQAALRGTAGVATGSDEDRPLVLALDDAQLLDHTTVAVLSQLVWAGGTRLVATVPDLAAAPEPLQVAWRSGRAEVVGLEPLDDLAVDTLVHRALGGPVDGAAMLALLDTSAGNPLFLRELVLGSMTAGRLVETGGVWRMSGPPEPSGMLRAVVQRRVSSLGPDVHALLEDLAIGAPVGLVDLASRHGEGALERAERAGLLRVLTDGHRRSVTLAHSLHGEVLRDALGTMASRRLARSHADATERHGRRRRDDDVRVALWRLTADGTAPVAMLSRAALLARAGRDLDSVERLARAALSRSPDPAVARALAETLYEQGRVAEAFDVVRTAREASGAGRVDPGLAATEALVLGFGLRRLADAEELLVTAAAALSGRPEVQPLVVPLALLRLWAEGPAAASRTLDGGPPESPDAASSRSRTAVTTLTLALGGRTAEALAASEHLTPSGPGLRHACRAVALTEAGRLAEAERLAADGHLAAARAGLRWQQMWFAGVLARVAMVRGRPRSALDRWREQASLADQLGHVWGARHGLTGQLTAAGWLADDGLMAEAWAAWQGIAGDDTEPGLLPGETARALAWRAARAGDLGAAHALLERAQRSCEQTGHVGQAALAGYERVRLGRAAAVVDDLRRYAGGTDSPLVAAYARHAAAEAGGDVDELAGVADDLWSLGLVLAAAEATAGAAAAARRRQDPRRAAAFGRLAATRRAEADDAHTPALALAPGDGASLLTPREREIALLVAQGMSSRDIATTLTLSVRTVDNHLQRVYAKLGVSGRAEVGTALEVDW